MKYIKVTNKTGKVNRLKLEKLGFSTKRDVTDTIGQFGSGIKFAPISAVRKGMEFIFAGLDDKGKYTLEYIVKDEDGIQSVFYKYEDYEKPSSFTIDAGLLSWETDFQIYREVVANAIDESKITGEPWTVDVVDVEKIEAVDGEFSVYISATPSILEIHNDFDQYFSVNRKPIYSNESIKLYEPIDNLIRVYCKGVLVYSGESTSDFSPPLSGLFDYEFGDELELNEERTVKSQAQMDMCIVRAISKIDNEDLIYSLFKQFRDLEQEDEYESFYETSQITHYTYKYIPSNTGLFKKVFDKNYPKTVLVNSDKLSHNTITALRAKGYDWYNLSHESLMAFLSVMDIPNYESIFGEYFVHDIAMGYDGYPVLKEAIHIVNEVIPETKEINDIIGVYFDEEDESTIAITTSIKTGEDDLVDKKILFNSIYAEDLNIKKMISTIIHEWDHYRTGYSDGNQDGRLFREVADQTIGELVYKLWKYKTLERSK